MNTQPAASTASARTHHRVSGVLALAMAAIAVVTPWSPAAFAATGPGPSTEGVIVWTARTANGGYLKIARADGSHSRSLTPVVPDEGDIDAKVSPDGRWIMFEHDKGDSSTVRLVRPDGSGLHDIPLPCDAPCAGISGGPSWLSNDRISYVVVNGPFSSDGNAASVAIMTARPDGSDVRRFSPVSAEGVYEYSDLRLSPDRSYTTFRRTDLALGHSALFRADPDGRHPHQLTPYALDTEVSDLSKARNGRTKDLLVFESYGRGDPTKTFVDIGTVPTTCGSLADCTSKIVWLTDNGASGRRNANPAWSPDGSSIVFAQRAGITDPNPEIWTQRYGGTVRRDVSNSLDFDFRPTWGVSCDQ